MYDNFTSDFNYQWANKINKEIIIWFSVKYSVY